MLLKTIVSLCIGKNESSNDMRNIKKKKKRTGCIELLFERIICIKVNVSQCSDIKITRYEYPLGQCIFPKTVLENS